MTVSTILLRLMLCVVFLLDGMGTAFASTAMTHAGHVAPDTTGHDRAPPCHEATATGDSAHTTAAPAEGPSDRSPSDCCTSGACRCACLHHAQHMGMATRVAVSPVRPASYPADAPPGHVAPTLPHLIRPPIG